MDADRLKKSDWMKGDWVAVLLLAMTAFCAFYFLVSGFYMDWDKEIKDLKFRLALLGVAVLLLYVVFFGLLAELT